MSEQLTMHKLKFQLKSCVHMHITHIKKITPININYAYYTVLRIYSYADILYLVDDDNL